MEKLKRFSTCFAVLVMLMICNCKALEPITDHRSNLRKYLLDEERYDRFNVPPKMSYGNQTVDVHMRLLILHVYDLIWMDSRLEWKPDEHAAINLLRVKKDSVWTPDVNLFNNAKTTNILSLGVSTMFIWHIGFVVSLTPVILKSTCLIDLRLYPFDEHVCNLTLGSWHHFTNDQLNLLSFKLQFESEASLLREFKTENPQWKIVKHSETFQNNSFSNPEANGQMYKLYMIQLRLQRQAPLFIFMIITPGTLAMVLTLTLFWVPPDSSGKLTMGTIAIGIQLTLALMLGQRIPSGGQYTPTIVLLVGNSLILSALSVVISVYVIRVTHPENTTAIPKRLNRVIHGPVGRMLCLRQGSTTDKQGLMDSDLGEIERNINEVKKKSPVDFKDGWLNVGLAVDRCCFILYCSIFLIIIIASFT